MVVKIAVRLHRPEIRRVPRRAVEGREPDLGDQRLKERLLVDALETEVAVDDRPVLVGIDDVSIVPEPTTMLLLGGGILAIYTKRRRFLGLGR